jgi:hypothetical protein
MARIVLLGCLILTTTPVLAAEPYIGVWASSAKACKADPHKTEDAAIRITRTEVLSGEWRCEIKRRTVTGKDWSLKAACAGEGEISTVGFESKRFTRCQDGDFQSITGN